MYGMDIGAFRAWLQACDPYMVVGWAAQETTCPIACWMGQIYHRTFRVAGSLVFLEDVPADSFSAPMWVPCFVAELDDLYDNHPVSVSAASALLVLDEVMVEAGYGSSC